MLSNLGRRICGWKRIGTDKQCVGELIVKGNQIEFYAQDSGNASPDVFVGGDKEYHYKVVTNGYNVFGANKTLNLSCSYNVRYALMQSFTPSEEREIADIIGFSFIIPELMDWFRDINTVSIFTNESSINVKEIDVPTIILRHDNPRISIDFESSSINETMRVDSRTEVIIKKQPRIFVSYKEPVNTEIIRKDIKTIMRFWGLMVGAVSDALDIRLDLQNSQCHSWLYLNGDFSYNTYAYRDSSRPRTTSKIIGNNITDYFTNWYDFCCNDDYDLIRNIYFSVNNRTPVFAEDIFVAYIRILEGYHLRKSNDEQRAELLKKAVSETRKEIKKLIFSDEGKPLFSKVLSDALPDWKYNSERANEISTWIAKGYLSHSNLESRIKKIDEDFFCILAKNSSIITDRSRQPQSSDTIQLYYEMLVATRNYYSHLKNDKDKLLSFRQINDSIFTLKALIIMVFLSQMQINKENIRQIMSWDAELCGRTSALRNKGEKCPFN